MRDEGVSLLELVFSVSIMVVLLGLFSSLPRFYQSLVGNQFSQSVVHFLHMGRAKAQALDAPISCYLVGRDLVMYSPASVIARLAVPSSLEVEIKSAGSVKRLGFTDGGGTRYAGSIEIQNGKKTHRVSLGFFGRVSWY